MVEKEFGERNFGFASLKNMNLEMEEKEIVAHDCLPGSPAARRREATLTASEAVVPRQRSVGLWR